MKTREGKIFLFRGTNNAIHAEQALLAAGFKPHVVPVPKRVSSDCGIAILIDMKTFPDAKAVLEKEGVIITNIVDASMIKII